MKTDKYMQGILVDDDQKRGKHYELRMLRVIKTIRRNLTHLQHFNPSTSSHKINRAAVFSRASVHGNVDQAISDIHNRLRHHS